MSVLTQFLAVLRLRMQEGVAARLWLLVPAGFVTGLLVARIAAGADVAARAAAADGLLLGAVTALVLLGVAVVAATSFPLEIENGVAHGLCATPLPRWVLFAGGALGHGTLGALLVVGAVLAGVLGLEAGGLGQRVRAPLRSFEVVDALAGADRATLASPVARFEFELDAATVREGRLSVRLAPRGVYEGGRYLRRDNTTVTLIGSGGRVRSSAIAGFAPGNPFAVEVPVGDIRPGPVTLEIARPGGALGLVFGPGSVRVGSPARRFVPSALLAALTAVPLVFLAAALASVTATRLGAPTAVIVTLFALLLHAGQDVLIDAAEHVLEVRAAAVSVDAEEHAGHAHDGDAHDEHGPAADVTALQGVLARGVLLALAPVPSSDAFDAGADLAAGRVVAGRRVERAVLAAGPSLLALLIAGALLVRGRELVPRG